MYQSNSFIDSLIERIVIREMRVKGAYRTLRTKYPNIPTYVFNDIYWVSTKNSDTQESIDYLNSIYESFNQLTWKLAVIKVTPFDFDNDTREHMEKRGFGTLNPDQVPRDKERMEIQSKLVKGDGKNEPIIVTKDENGYSLVEGWHRTMNLLKLGEQPNNVWTPVLIKAWVGSS